MEPTTIHTNGATRHGVLRSDEDVRKRFEFLAAQWYEGTRFESNYARILSHRAFRGIIGLGPQAVPLILKELEKGQAGAWFQALEDITGENPVAPGHEADSALMIADWLTWGRSNGIV
jgi:hypothetical protein